MTCSAEKSTRLKSADCNASTLLNATTNASQPPTIGDRACWFRSRSGIKRARWVEVECDIARQIFHGSRRCIFRNSYCVERSSCDTSEVRPPESRDSDGINDSIDTATKLAPMDITNGNCGKARCQANRRRMRRMVDMSWLPSSTSGNGGKTAITVTLAERAAKQPVRTMRSASVSSRCKPSCRGEVEVGNEA